MTKIRQPNAFEKVLLIIGILVVMIGYGLIHRMVILQGFGWPTLEAILLWFILIFIIIIAAVNENMKEELRDVVENQLNEIRLLRTEMRLKKR